MTGVWDVQGLSLPGVDYLARQKTISRLWSKLAHRVQGSLQGIPISLPCTLNHSLFTGSRRLYPIARFGKGMAVSTPSRLVVDDAGCKGGGSRPAGMGWIGEGGVTNVRADDRTLAGDFGAHPHTSQQTSTLSPVLAPHAYPPRSPAFKVGSDTMTPYSICRYDNLKVKQEGYIF